MPCVDLTVVSVRVMGPSASSCSLAEPNVPAYRGGASHGARLGWQAAFCVVGKQAVKIGSRRCVRKTVELPGGEIPRRAHEPAPGGPRKRTANADPTNSEICRVVDRQPD